MSSATKPPATAQAVGRSSAAGPIAGIEEIRVHFPALQRQHAGASVAYFDGPGGTQVPRAVVDAVADYLYHHNANTHWKYPTSAETDEMFAYARQALADFVGGNPAEIVFGANATSLAFHVSRALGRVLSPGDEIVITELDHHANVGPWQALAHERHCTLRTVRIHVASGTLDWSDFEQKVTKRTKLVAVGAASNALGTISDVRQAARHARAVGALTFVDAVHYAPHNLPDVHAMECDFMICSAYKFYGPHVGVLWCRGELLESLPFAKLLPAPNKGPERAETGTLNHEGIAGAAAAVDFLASLATTSSPAISPPRVACGDLAGNGPARPKMGRLYSDAADTRRESLCMAFAALHERSALLTQQLWEGLAAINGVKLFGPTPDVLRTSTVAFTVRDVPSSEVAHLLADRGLFLSHGNFYAATVVERLGLAPEGLVRAGCAIYTTPEEVSRLIAGVCQIAGQQTVSK